MRRRSRRGGRGPLAFQRRSRLSRALLAARTVGWLSWRVAAIVVGELRSGAGRR